MRTTLSWLACLGFVLNGLRSSDAAVVFVNSQAATCGDGQSWATAYRHLQDALTAARNSGGTITQIWVAAGTYKPDRDCANPNGTGDRAATFSLVDGVALRGGFSGDEDPATFDLAARDFEANQTILSGDLAGDDGPNFAFNGENSYQVVSAKGMGTSTVLDGFTIAGGNAYDVGGGLHLSDGSPSIANCTFRGNWAKWGGGLYASGSSPMLIACKFVGNQSFFNGGGAHFSGGGTPVLINCLFSSNEAANGGGLSNSYMLGSPSPSTTLINCTFVANSASRGSDVYNDNATLTAVNCIFWSSGPIEVMNYAALAITYSCIRDGWTGTGNISTDPKFLADGTLRPMSPCIDVGDNSPVPDWVTKDLSGKPRFVDDPFGPDTGNPGSPAKPIVDMGAYEFQDSAKRIMYVKVAAAPGGDGQSWSTAYKHLQDALAAVVPDPQLTTEIWLAQGVYRPDRTAAVPEGTGNRAATFQLLDQLAVYGGFQGEPGQEGDFNARAPRLYVTILSGDLAGDDGPDFANNGENSYHVVTASSVSAILSGCVVSAGNSNTGTLGDRGAGLHNWSGSLTVGDCVFEGNSTLNSGGGVYVYSANSSFRRCLFRNNSAGSAGGAIARSYGTLTLTGCAFIQNTAPYGGGL
jgi:predicted outer membrane repeat protein